MATSDAPTPPLPAGARHPSASVFWETHVTQANPYVPTGLPCGLPTGQRSPGPWADVHKDASRFDNSLEDGDQPSPTSSPHRAPHTPRPPPTQPGSQHTFAMPDRGVSG